MKFNTDIEDSLINNYSIFGVALMFMLKMLCFPSIKPIWVHFIFSLADFHQNLLRSSSDHVSKKLSKYFW